VEHVLTFLLWEGSLLRLYLVMPKGAEGGGKSPLHKAKGATKKPGRNRIVDNRVVSSLLCSNTRSSSKDTSALTECSDANRDEVEATTATRSGDRLGSRQYGSCIPGIGQVLLRCICRDSFSTVPGLHALARQRGCKDGPEQGQQIGSQVYEVVQAVGSSSGSTGRKFQKGDCVKISLLGRSSGCGICSHCLEGKVDECSSPLGTTSSYCSSQSSNGVVFGPEYVIADMSQLIFSEKVVSRGSCVC